MSQSLDYASKLNRDPAFIDKLIAHGEAQAEQFLATLPSTSIVGL